jgi:hypothetical protein
MRRPSTAREVIDVLGGLAPVMSMTHVSSKTVYHWIAIGKFPARHYEAMKRALAGENCSAPPWMWNQAGFAKNAA